MSGTDMKHSGYAGDRVDVYPVGLLHDLRLLWLTARHAPADIGSPVRRLWRTRSSWRRRSYWNGYPAEPTVSGKWTRAGHGWTRKRALRDLNRHLVEVRDA